VDPQHCGDSTAAFTSTSKPNSPMAPHTTQLMEIFFYHSDDGIR
jgi:hypothetical protein